MSGLTPAQRSAVARTLRDIHDGHITLTAEVRRYDPTTGERLARRQVTTVSDRMPSPSFPDRSMTWWRYLADEGWLVLDETTEPARWRVTDAGLEVARKAPGLGGKR
jgi:hypothetical protein